MPSNIVKSFATKTGKSVDVVEKLWSKAKEVAKKEYPKVKDDEDFYKIVTGILKKMLKIEEEETASTTTGDVQYHAKKGLKKLVKRIEKKLKE